MAAVEVELRARQTRLDVLSAEYAQAERLASVNREAAVAIRQELAQVVQGESRRSILVTIAASLPLGVVAGVISILLLQHFESH